MIHEMRTYRLKVGAVAAYLKLVQEQRIEVQKAHLGRLVGYSSTEIGPLNEVVHVWAYEDLNDRARRRAKLARVPAEAASFDRDHGKQISCAVEFLAIAVGRGSVVPSVAEARGLQ